MMQLGIEVKGETSEHPAALKNEGTLRAELRFAKGSAFQFFILLFYEHKYN